MKKSIKYDYQPYAEAIAAGIGEITSDIGSLKTPDVLRRCFSMMDLTTLRPEDTPSHVRAFVQKTLGLTKAFPSCPMPSSVCVYPNLVTAAVQARDGSGLSVTSVAGAFPSSQSFPEVKVLESRMAVRDGADEVDIVLPLGAFLSEDYESAYREICLVREAIDEEAAWQGRGVVLKVILETGVLEDAGKIAIASFLAMEAGADFIKTSTGKVAVNATPLAACVMCECIKKYHEVSGRMVGIKVAGGISTSDQALGYYNIVSSVLGERWLDRKYFRFGVSRLGNSLLSAIENKDVTWF